MEIIDHDLKILEDIFYKTIESVDPVKQMHNHTIEPPKGKTFFAAVGKGAGRLSRAFKETFQGESSGIVVIPENEYCEDFGYRVFKSSHPLPSEAGIQASKALLENVSILSESDLFVFIISGGASSLLPLPPEGFTLADEISLNKSLLESGAPISVMNAFRSYFSRIKAGKLGQAAFPCPVITLVVCDIPGDDISLVGSGPTFCKDYSNLDLRALVDFYKIRLDKSILNFFLSEQENVFQDKALQINNKNSFTLSSGTLAIKVASIIAKENYGLNVLVLAESVEDDSELLAATHAKVIKGVVEYNSPVKKPAFIISGGESLVNLPSNYGKGGRNSHFALALATKIKGLAGVSGFAADTDGIDGNGNNAGAMFTGETFEKAKVLGIDLHEHLDKYDSYVAFKKLGSLLISGPTGVNVNDIRAIIVR